LYDLTRAPMLYLVLVARFWKRFCASRSTVRAATIHETMEIDSAQATPTTQTSTVARWGGWSRRKGRVLGMVSSFF
jgi:hypothetical protein